MLPEIGVSLNFLGRDFEPQTIARQLGLRATKTWLEGDPIGSSMLKHKQTGFSVESALHRTHEVEPQIRSILNCLADVDRSVLAEMGLQLEVSCVVYVSDEPPALHLGSDTLRVMVGLSAALDIDLILVGEPDASRQLGY